MRRMEYFFEETLPGQLIGTLGGGGPALLVPDYIGGDGMSKQEYLHELAYDCLSDEQVLQGFAEHYLCAGLSSLDLCRDVCICASASAAQVAGERLMDIFQQLAGKKKAPSERQLR